MTPVSPCAPMWRRQKRSCARRTRRGSIWMPRARNWSMPSPFSSVRHLLHSHWLRRPHCKPACRPFPPVCPPICWSAVPISPMQNAWLPLPMPISVARAAWFPALTLSAAGGYSGSAFSQLFDTPGRVWSLGSALAALLFDGGARHARNDQARAAFDAAVATYKQTVLSGLQEVEDNLSTLRVLAQESQVQDQAVKAAQLSERLAMSQYQAGTSTYLSVLTTQAASLANQRGAVQLLGRQLLASVSLIKAVGGGWHASDMNQAAANH